MLLAVRASRAHLRARARFCSGAAADGGRRQLVGELRDPEGRKQRGRSGSSVVRRQGFVPGLIYGASGNKKGSDLGEILVKVDQKAIDDEITELDWFMENQLYDLTIDDKTYMVVPRHVQRHGLTGAILNVNYLLHDAEKGTKVEFPIEYIKAENSPCLQAGKCGGASFRMCVCEPVYVCAAVCLRRPPGASERQALRAPALLCSCTPAILRSCDPVLLLSLSCSLSPALSISLSSALPLSHSPVTLLRVSLTPLPPNHLSLISLTATLSNPRLLSPSPHNHKAVR